MLDTRFFKNENGENFVGAAGSFVVNDDQATLRLDPEGIRVSPHGTFYVSDADLNLAATIPEKIEGLAWGPDLPDGRHVLYVISDNDLNPSLATQIYAFAIDPSLLNFQPQLIHGPLYPPGGKSRRR